MGLMLRCQTMCLLGPHENDLMGHKLTQTDRDRFQAPSKSESQAVPLDRSTIMPHLFDDPAP
jgi:hypothetical protein